MRPNFLLKIVLMLSLVLNFLLSSSFAAEDFNPINCARLVLPPIGRLSIDEEYALFEKRILIPEENITIESYPGSKDIFTVSNGTRLIPQKESLPCAKDWQQRLFHRYQLNIWKEDHREMVPLTVLLPAEFTQLHDRDRFMINLRAALGRAFTYEDLKKFIHESSAKKDFALRFQFLPGGLTKNLLHTYFEHTQVCPKRLDIKHTPDNSALDHHPESNAAEVLLPEEYKNGVTPSVAQFFHWINNLRALKMMYDDPVTKQNFFSHNKFRHRDEKIGLIFQDFSPAFMAARENILNDLSSRQIPPAPAPAKIVGQDPALPLRTYPEAFFNTHLNAQDEVQYSLDWINPAHPAIIASIPLNFEDLAPRNYEDGYWRNFVARLFGTILPLEARSKLGKVVIRVRPDLAEITTTVIPLAEAANKYAVTIEIPRTPQSSKRNIGITSLINSLGNLAYHNEAVSG